MQEYQYLTWVWELQNNNKKRKKKKNHIKTATFPFSFFLKLEIQLDYYREGQIMFLRQAESKPAAAAGFGEAFCLFPKGIWQ